MIIKWAAAYYWPLAVSYDLFKGHQRSRSLPEVKVKSNKVTFDMFSSINTISICQILTLKVMHHVKWMFRRLPDSEGIKSIDYWLFTCLYRLYPRRDLTSEHLNSLCIYTQSSARKTISQARTVCRVTIALTSTFDKFQYGFGCCFLKAHHWYIFILTASSSERQDSTYMMSCISAIRCLTLTS